MSFWCIPCIGLGGFGKRLLLGSPQVVGIFLANRATPEGACLFHCWTGISEVHVGGERATQVVGHSSEKSRSCAHAISHKVFFWQTTSSIWWSSISIARGRFCVCPLFGCFVFAWPNRPCQCKLRSQREGSLKCVRGRWCSGAWLKGLVQECTVSIKFCGNIAIDVAW